MLINLSNHPETIWSEEQISAANKLYGEITDIPFPHIDPKADENYINQITDEYFKTCAEKLSDTNGENSAVHLMGELNFTFALVYKLLKAGIKCVSSTTERNTIEKDGMKISNFKFVRFREYKLC